MQDRKYRNITKLRSNCKIYTPGSGVSPSKTPFKHSDIWNMEVIGSRPHGSGFRYGSEKILRVAIYPEDWPDNMIENGNICEVSDRGESLNSIFQYVVDKMLIAGDPERKWEFLPKKEKEPKKEEVLTNYDEQRYG